MSVKKIKYAIQKHECEYATLYKYNLQKEIHGMREK